MSKTANKRYGHLIGKQVMCIMRTREIKRFKLEFLGTYTISGVYKFGVYLEEVPNYGFLFQDFLLLSDE